MQPLWNKMLTERGMSLYEDICGRCQDDHGLVTSEKSGSPHTVNSTDFSAGQTGEAFLQQIPNDSHAVAATY